MLRWFMLLLLLLPISALATDFKIRTVIRSHFDGSSLPDFDSTAYVQGQKRRSESRGFIGVTPADRNLPKPRMAVISDCATRRSYEIDLDSREYVKGELPRYPSE